MGKGCSRCPPVAVNLTELRTLQMLLLNLLHDLAVIRTSINCYTICRSMRNFIWLSSPVHEQAILSKYSSKLLRGIFPQAILLYIDTSYPTLFPLCCCIAHSMRQQVFYSNKRHDFCDLYRKLRLCSGTAFGELSKAGRNRQRLSQACQGDVGLDIWHECSLSFNLFHTLR